MQPPIGFWDPLGFTKTDDAASFRRRRYVELKQLGLGGVVGTPVYHYQPLPKPYR